MPRRRRPGRPAGRAPLLELVPLRPRRPVRDFATFNQAWSQIGQGHLNPTDTVQGIGFWQNHFELILWPIGLLHLLSSSPFVLLVLQDLAIVGTELLIVLWVAGVCVERLGSVRVWVVGAALAVTVWNPWWYETASFDFHPEMLGLPLVVLSAYSLWRGRPGVALVAGLLALLCGDVATLLVVAVGIAAVVSRHARAAGSTRAGLTLVALGAAWFVLITALHANQGSAVTANYDYLAGTRPGASAWSVYLGVAGHPGHVASVLGSRWHPVEKVLASAGIIGVATPWGFFVLLITLLPAALNVNPAFVSPLTAFQTLPVVPFVLVGTFMLLVTLGVGGTRRTKGRPAAAWGIAGVLVLVALVQSSGLLLQLRSDWWHHDTAQADALHEASQKIGPGGEVIASWDAMGGFADRTDIVPLVAVPQTFQLHSGTTWAVIVADHGNGLSAADSAAGRGLPDHAGARDRRHRPRRRVAPALHTAQGRTVGDVARCVLTPAPRPTWPDGPHLARNWNLFYFSCGPAGGPRTGEVPWQKKR